MGGNALKTVATRRYARDEYVQKFGELQRRFPFGKYTRAMALIRSYANKESFGDMDIIMSAWDFDELVAGIKEHLAPDELIVNGNCITFNFDDLQVDFIVEEPDVYSFSWHYHNYNDLGNFIGRIARGLGFKFGHDGLWYEYYCPRHPTNKVEDILVTSNYWLALWFLGFMEMPLSTEILEKEDVFRFVEKSVYFDPAAFLLHNRNSDGRRRDKKRQMYHDLLAYLQERYPHLNDETKPVVVDKEMHLNRALVEFTDFYTAYEDCAADHYKNLIISDKINGDAFGPYLGLHGKQLGDVLRWCREYVKTNQLEHWLHGADQELVCRVFLAIVAEMQPALLKENDHA